jgi:hypothetical protein
MVIGIVAKNGILLLVANRQFSGWGFAPPEAMIQAGRMRLRPIVMTALATVGHRSDRRNRVFNGIVASHYTVRVLRAVRAGAGG